MSLFIKRRKVFFEQSEKTIRPQRYNNTQKSSRVRAYNRSFIIFAVTSVTVLQQHPNKQLVITIFGLKSSRSIPYSIERHLFQRFILRLSSPFFRTCVTLVTAKNQKLGCNARAYARVIRTSKHLQQILSPSLSVHFPDYKKLPHEIPSICNTEVSFNTSSSEENALFWVFTPVLRFISPYMYRATHLPTIPNILNANQRKQSISWFQWLKRKTQRGRITKSTDSLSYIIQKT